VGAILVVGGILFFVAGAIHPQGARGSFHDTIASYLASSAWPLAHWLALISTIVVLWAIWLLVDDGWVEGSVAAWAGARLVLLAGVFMAVEFAVELTAAHEAANYASGNAAPLALLTEPMQTVGWPAWMVGFALLALGARASAPRVVRLIGVIGAAAMGVGGITVEVLKIVATGPLFIGGALLAFWMVWAGVVAVRGQRAIAATLSPATREAP
jgi:hypothetical protein